MKKKYTVILLVVFFVTAFTAIRFWPNKHAQEYGAKTSNALTKSRAELSPVIGRANIIIANNHKTSCSSVDDPALNYYNCITSATASSASRPDSFAAQQAVLQLDDSLKQIGWLTATDNFTKYKDSARFSFDALLANGAMVHYTKMVNGSDCELKVLLKKQFTSQGAVSCSYESKLAGERVD